MKYTAKQAEGCGRTDWVVMGPCSCVVLYPEQLDYPDCPTCDGYSSVQIFAGLTKSEAKNRAEQLNKGTYTPFNQIRIR